MYQKLRQQPWLSVCNYEMNTFNKYTKIQRVYLRGIKLFSHNVPCSIRVFNSQSCVECCPRFCVNKS